MSLLAIASFASLCTGQALAAGAPDGPGAIQATTHRSAGQLTVDGVDIRVDFPESPFRGGTAPLLAWIERSIGIVASYYGRFPTHVLRIQMAPVDGDGVRGGKSFGGREDFIRVQVGRDVTAAQLLDDWVLVHEMIHLALPDVGPQHAWLSEGLATYVEGIARAQAGNRTPENIWAEHVAQMPRGLPQPDDRGLDNTHTWGRTYWGGALFCLLADVEIHRRTHNRFGLQDALRAVTKASGGLAADWPITRVLTTGDAAVGVPVLQDLYAQMKDAPVKPDLPALWHLLGIEPDGAIVRLRDDAPESDIRRAIIRSTTGQ